MEKAATFRALHDGPGTFIIPNPWDAGTARLLAAANFDDLPPEYFHCPPF